jgi:hypothetical protein
VTRAFKIEHGVPLILAMHRGRNAWLTAGFVVTGQFAAIGHLGHGQLLGSGRIPSLARAAFHAGIAKT